MHKLFITGTDTGVGKSIFTACFSNFLKSIGYSVAISKPFQSGDPKDTEYLKELTNNEIPIFNTYSLNLPAAPSVAAKDENIIIDINKTIQEIKDLENKYDFLLVEGVGGIAVPITDCYLVSNFIKALNYPCVVVARKDLGTINHTLLTIGHAKSRGLGVIGFVISGYDEKTIDKVIRSNPNEIEKYSKTKFLGKIPMLNEINYQSIRSIDSSVFSEILSSLSSSNNPSSAAKV